MHLPERQDLLGTELLRLARGSIEYGLSHGEPLSVDCNELSAPLTEMAATFTTLRADGELRGCRGTLKATRPVAEDVSWTAFQAAFEDPRFVPVAEHELTAISLEVSVLSPMEPLPVIDEADLLAKLTPGTDGLVILAHGRSATFLPTVWGQLPETQDFVAALKAKCGLQRDYWSDQLGFMRYRTTSYAESS
jgi:AmmeMemoRadiSam system protein A